MRLEPFGELRLTYEERGFTLVKPYASEEGSGYGAGSGSIAGERLRGTVRWLNAPHRRSDVVMLPHCHGLIETDDGATVVFLMEGRTPLTGEEALGLDPCGRCLGPPLTGTRLAAPPVRC